MWVAKVLAKGGDPMPQLMQAETLLRSLGGLCGLVKASTEQLVALGYLDAHQLALLTAVQRVAGSSQSAGQTVINSYRALEYFLRAQRMETDAEMTRALVLGDHHCLRADVILARGSSPLSFDQRRELARLCIEHRACAAILVRSVQPVAPAIADATREANVVARSLEMLGMRLLDYVLVSRSETRRIRWHACCTPGRA
jgi:DNA repair protein RadC